jgi:hypothetical protein
MLTDTQVDRYSRQIVLPEVGGRGQQRLLGSQLVLISALGELEPALSYLVGAGVGTISIRVAASAQDRRRISARMRDLNSDVKLTWDKERPAAGSNAARPPDALLIFSAGEPGATSVAKAARSADVKPKPAAMEGHPGRLSRQADKTALQPSGTKLHHIGIDPRSGAPTDSNDVTQTAQTRYTHLERIPTVGAHLGEPLELVVIPSHPPCLECIGAHCLKPVAPRAAGWEMVAMMAATEVLKLLLGLTSGGATMVRFHGLAARHLRRKPRAYCRICSPR